MSCNDSFRSKIWHYCQESKISLQKRAKSLIFYSEQFFGHQFSAKSGSHIFWDKWNVEADSESLLKNLKLLPYSILMPDHSIKLYFTGSKDIQIWEYLRAHICSQKILLTLNWIWKIWLVWHKFFLNTQLGVTCIAIRICINIYDSFKIEGCAGFFLTMP